MNGKLFRPLLFLGIFIFLFFNFGCTGEIRAMSPAEVAMYSLCGLFLAALPIMLLLVTVLAALVYAVGQMMGAETRARATVWATSLMVGAIIAALIFIIVPFILDKLMPDLNIGMVRSLCASAAQNPDALDPTNCACGADESCVPLYNADTGDLIGYQCVSKL